MDAGNPNGSFSVRPEVICVGFNKSRNVRIYLMDHDHDFEHVDPTKDDILKEIAEHEQDWYVVGEKILDTS